jgi:hypothetical protein
MSFSHSWVFWIVLSSTGTLLITVLLAMALHLSRARDKHR